MIVSFTSFRRGTGKSTVAASAAVLLAQQGKHVGLMDLNFTAPSLQTLFNIGEMPYTLNGFLWGDCEIQAVQSKINRPFVGGSGSLHVFTASEKLDEIARMGRGGYYLPLLDEAFETVTETYRLDYLLLDTPGGLAEETLFTLGLADVTAILVRPDRQDYQGTALLADLARRFNPTQRVWLIVNQVSPRFNAHDVQRQIKAAFQEEVAEVIPHAAELMVLGGAEPLAVRYPEAPLTAQFKALITRLVEPLPEVK
jgi:MinD-like ATPase involved in chromosome partitioning or flagellar assembly